MENEPIDGGYIILARRILESEIWKKSPAFLKVWIYILQKVNFDSSEKYPRGTGYFNFREEKIPYVTLNQVYNFLRWAKTLAHTEVTTQITTQKTTRGMVIKVNNYNKYQDVNNYCKQHTKQHEKQQTNNTITKRMNKEYIVKSIDNISLSNKEKITKEEREILKNYVQNTCKVKTSISAYIRKLLDNGDYVQILEDEKKKQERERAKAEKKKQEEKAKQKTPEQLQKEREETQKAFENARKKIFKNKRGETK